MSGVVKIEITESSAALKTLLQEQKTAAGKERVQALYLLKTILWRRCNIWQQYWVAIV